MFTNSIGISRRDYISVGKTLPDIACSVGTSYLFVTPNGVYLVEIIYR